MKSHLKDIAIQIQWGSGKEFRNSLYLPTYLASYIHCNRVVRYVWLSEQVWGIFIMIFNGVYVAIVSKS